MLTVDLGNSRLKALLWGPTLRSSTEPPAPAGSFEGESSDLDPFARWLEPLRGRPGALSSVASTARSEAVQRALEAAGVRLHVAPDSGLENRCRPPEGVGTDRLYAAAAAAELCAGACLVVDAGTALTVDAVAVEGPVRVFLGGAIAPGPALLAAVLAEGTARLPLIQPEPGARALGRSTEEALRAGIGLGFRGAARALVEGLAAETGLAAAPLVLTGGARAHLLLPVPFTTRPLRVVPDLVHRGLLAALRAAEARGGTA
ncbi:MAG TPA: type III pantothenate kinase [Planctomycetota bacterium]